MNLLLKKIYRYCLSFYPKAFRDKYSEQILQTVEDMEAEEGLSWSKLLVDYFISIPREYMYKIYNINNMNKKFMILAGTVGLVSAVAYILLDDNNIVSLGVENVVYTIAWLGIISTALLALRQRKLRSAR